MSKKSYSVLTVTVQLAIPPGWTQQATVEEIRKLVSSAPSIFHPGTVIVKPVKRETSYL
jgi:hypothetical protein